MINPFSVLRIVIKDNPNLKPVLGVAALLAVLALASSWQLNAYYSAFGALVVVLLMVLLLIFGNLSQQKKGLFTRPAMILLWSVVIFAVGASALLLSSVFFGKPLELRPGVTSAAGQSSSLFQKEVMEAANPELVSDLVERRRAYFEFLGDSQKNIFANDLALVIKSWNAKSKNDQVRIIRNIIIDYIKEYSTFDFYTYFEKGDFVGADLVKADFSDTYINKLSFRNSFMIGASFKNARLDGVDFRDASLKHVDFSGASIDNSSNFEGSDWYNSNGIMDGGFEAWRGGSLSSCPDNIDGFIKSHDDRYRLWKFRDLDISTQAELKQYWSELMRPDGVCSRIKLARR